MDSEQFDYGRYFEELQKVNVSIILDEGSFFDGSADIKTLQGNMACLEMFGDNLPPSGLFREGVNVVLSNWNRGALYGCAATVEKISNDSLFSIKLNGPVKELQRREFFRLDVSLPVIYEILDSSNHEELGSLLACDGMKACKQPQLVRTEDGFKVLDWIGGNDVLPTRMNLSGGGVRFKVPELIEPGKTLKLTIFLPLVKPRVICAVAEVLRCQEISLSWERGISYSLSMKFLHLNEKDQEEIIMYLFAEQRRELQKKGELLKAGKTTFSS
jgi:hypothetical protein